MIQSSVSDHLISQQISFSRLFFCALFSLGQVSLTYNDPICHRTVSTNPVAFKLVRTLEPSADLLQVNLTLERQRIRVETVDALEKAMAETNFAQSRAMLRAQAERIKASPLAADPFCQGLVRDLERAYPTESAYRSSHHNVTRCHQSERGTYITAGNASSEQYSTAYQHRMADRIKRKYFGK